MGDFAPVTLADWRALVDKDLAGVQFEKALVHEIDGGLTIQPLYAQGPDRPGALEGAPRRARICTRHERAATLAGDLVGGVDGVWLAPGDEKERTAMSSALAGFRGEVLRDGPGVVSTLPYHEAGADAVDELGLALAAGVARLRAGDVDLMFRVSVGRETFVELCKLRALRVCWGKVAVACGIDTNTTVHAVCSSRTLTERDAAVNMLRVTTQLFAAMLGGADWVTPLPFDAALGESSALARRVARNTALVLREESQLDRVSDPAGGAYFFESLTDDLARAAWARFQENERVGGLAAYEKSGRLAADLEAAWAKRAQRLRTRKEAIVGVSEFAALDDRPASTGRVSGHRDAEMLEDLRRRLETHEAKVALVTLGPPAESRARVGFARSLFAVGGLASEEASGGEIACLCGSDERYAAEAIERARQLKASGTERLYLAGRPGALEGALRDAGVDEFIYVGCDVVAALAPIREPTGS